jgi:recombination protein RecA
MHPGERMPTNDDKRQRLEKTVEALQLKWGSRALQRLQKQNVAIPVVATGFPVLDEALGIGGLPRGRITEILGAPSSGMSTLILKLIANVQAEGETAVYLDVERVFDPAYATRCGVVLEQLILIRPYKLSQAMAILQDFIDGGGAAVIICDLPAYLLQSTAMVEAVARALDRSLASLGRSSCALICLISLPPGTSPALDHYPPGMTLPHLATIRLLLQRERWVYHRRDIRGYQVEAVIVKNKLGKAGQTVRLTITFAGVMGDDDQE